MFENPRRGRQARNFTTNVPKIVDRKSSSEQIFSENCRWVPLLWSYYNRYLHQRRFFDFCRSSSPSWKYWEMTNCLLLSMFTAMIWALKMAAWFLWQRMQENGAIIAMASSLDFDWLLTSYDHFDPLFSLVYFSGLTEIYFSPPNSPF